MTIYKIEGKKKSRTCQPAIMPHAFNPPGVRAWHVLHSEFKDSQGCSCLKRGNPTSISGNSSAITYTCMHPHTNTHVHPHSQTHIHRYLKELVSERKNCSKTRSSPLCLFSQLQIRGVQAEWHQTLMNSKHHCFCRDNNAS